MSHPDSKESAILRTEILFVGPGVLIFYNLLYVFLVSDEILYDLPNLKQELPISVNNSARPSSIGLEISILLTVCSDCIWFGLTGLVVLKEFNDVNIYM